MRVFVIVLLIINIFKCLIEDKLQLVAIANIIFFILYLEGV